MDIPYYSPVGHETEIFEHAYRNHLPLLLKGPTGTGKTRFISHMAAKLGQKLVTVSCHEETSAIDLLGRYLIKGTETVWQDGPLTHAVREGYIIYIDEIAEARPDTIVILHSLTDSRRVLFNERTNEEIPAKDSFMLTASFNPEYQGSWKELKPSTRQRFISIQFNYPRPKEETEIILHESGVERKTAEKLVELAGKVRSMKELSLSETISTRLLVDAAKLIRSGLSPRLSCETGIIEPLTDDRDTASALKDIISLYI
ncbi:MAG TPA: CbbQ/NirQ/NorQ/GpvN family protein [Leptospiraceae bacterium]|nr:CbbQ/NirQ/NorQ/GpvN family protein [Leptospiraceae bacterium]HMZ60713.1 CbbQ/NirQ/NorQ/GpvN family protein [Leptospiraceae bacterium]HNF15687.1 CbbQ/NirQ/NorQ/GpvN family protein [Leptospiraceae bacterium]HNH11399.1 CbbQ/NirQ/NorQ/GpvN family protein [Leptospiraceae bacterium]HNI95981.1 CbbQ/NirQ/NorQ/GpvN family protein [Leptospiraceae bacterium]